MRNFIFIGAAALAFASPAIAQSNNAQSSAPEDVKIPDDGYVYSIDCVPLEDGTEYCDATPIAGFIPPAIKRDIVLAKGVKLLTTNQPEVIDIIPQISPEGLTLAHPAERLNTVAGVNIHRGSGQEHLTAIRSPVLTGGAGAGSFLFKLPRLSRSLKDLGLQIMGLMRSTA